MLCPDKVRRVKCYSTNRAFEATRGSTIYDVSSKSLLQDMANVSSLVCDWMNQRATASAGVRKGSESREMKRGKHFDVMKHELERRRDAIESPEDTFGVRVELTFASRDWNFLNEALQLLRIQDKRRCMSSEEFELHFREKPEEWPWFMKVPCAEHKRQRNERSFALDAALMPVTILRCKEFFHLGVAMENSLITTARNMYMSSRALVSRDASADSESSNYFYSAFLRVLPQGVSCNLGLLICRGLLFAARTLLDAEPCSFHDVTMLMPGYVLSACGHDASYYYGGCPQVICSRVLSLDRTYERVLRSVNPGNCTIIPQLRRENEDMEFIAAELDRLMGLPESAHLTSRKQKSGLIAQVRGVHYDAERLETAGVGRSEGNLCQVLHSIFRTETSRAIEKSLRAMAAVVTLLLVSDCMYELEDMLGFSPSRNDSLRLLQEHEDRTNPPLTASLPRVRARLTKNEVVWPNHFRIDLCNLYVGEEQEMTLEARIRRLLVFYRGEGVPYMSIGEQGASDFRNTLTEGDGTITADRFVQGMWEISNLLPYYSEISCRDEFLSYEERNTTKWKSNFPSNL